MLLLIVNPREITHRIPIHPPICPRPTGRLWETVGETVGGRGAETPPNPPHEITLCFLGHSRVRDVGEGEEDLLIGALKRKIQIRELSTTSVLVSINIAYIITFLFCTKPSSHDSWLNYVKLTVITWLQVRFFSFLTNDVQQYLMPNRKTHQGLKSTVEC